MHSLYLGIKAKGANAPLYCRMSGKQLLIWLKRNIARQKLWTGFRALELPLRGFFCFLIIKYDKTFSINVSFQKFVISHFSTFKHLP